MQGCYKYGFLPNNNGCSALSRRLITSILTDQDLFFPQKVQQGDTAAATPPAAPGGSAAGYLENPVLDVSHEQPSDLQY